MALDLSMKSSRRPETGSPGPDPGLTDPPRSLPVGLVTKKRVRFLENGRTHHLHYQHPHPYGGRVGWRRGVFVPLPDSDEENRPPSTSSDESSAESATSGSDCDSRLSSHDSHQATLHPAAMTGHVTVTSARDDHILSRLPSDPRDWSRADVASWLHHMKTTHCVSGLQPDRFLMNGKALCLMSAAMFAYRVPLGGKLLYRDFRMRLSLALANQDAASIATTMTSATTSNATTALTSSPPVAPPARA